MKWYLLLLMIVLALVAFPDVSSMAHRAPEPPPPLPRPPPGPHPQ